MRKTLQRKKMKKYIFTLLLVPFICGCSGSSDNNRHAIDLSGSWRIIESDSIDCASPSYDDSGFPGIKIPGNWLAVLEKNENLTSIVWLRKKVFIGRDFSMKQPELFIERIGVADEAYFNGVKIGSSGVFPESPSGLSYQISWHTPRRYFIPDNLVKYGGENVIALRVYSHIQSGVMGEVVLRDYHDEYFVHALRGFRPLLINTAAVILNIMLIFIFLMMFSLDRNKTEYLYFLLIIITTLLCTFLTFTLPFMIDGLLRYKLGLLLYTLTNFFVFLGVKEFLSYRNRPLTCTMLCLLALVETMVMASPESRTLVFYSGIICLIFVVLCIFVSLAVFIIAVKRDPIRYWYFLLIAVPISFSVARNAYYIFSYRFNELPLTIFMHVPLVFMFITLYTIYDNEKSKKEKDNLYKALLAKSRNDIRVLKSLKIKDRKPEPRDIISKVIEYLDNNYAEKYDRIELSKKFGLNEDYMGQLFKKATGTNISNYINTNRINAARELAVDTNAKIIDIAYHVGFDNLTHFHRQFKLQTGCTPNEYRTFVKKRSD